MADPSAVTYYNTLAERGYYNRIIAASIIQMVEVDSVAVDTNVYPYDVKTYARQKIVRETTVTERSLVTTCRLLNTTRSDDNPQGFLIEHFTVIENNDLRTYER